MKNEMRKLVVLCALFIGVMTVSAQLSQHGLVLNGGLGRVDFKNAVYTLEMNWSEIDYNANAALGYRFRFKQPAPRAFHFDVDVSGGVKFLRTNVRGDWQDYEEGSIEGYKPAYGGGSGYFAHSSVASSQNWFTSIGLTANYSIFKNFSIGLGVEPTYYFKGDKWLVEHWGVPDVKTHFDVPVVGKIAYNLKFMEIGITGKYGLANVLESTYLKNGKIGDLQLSVFIPFKTK